MSISSASTLKTKILLGSGMMVFGTINSLLLKYQTRIESPNSDGDCTLFRHGLFQTLSMIFAEFICLPMYYLFYIFLPHRRPIATISPYKFLFPTFLDLSATLLSIYSLPFIYVSDYESFRTASVLFTAILSYYLYGLSGKPRTPQKIGLSIIFCSILTVTLVSILGGHDTESTTIGYTLVATSQVFVGLQFLTEQKIVQHQQVPALQAVGLEGMWGISLIFFACVCSFLLSFTGYEPLKYVITDLSEALIQVKNSWKLIVSTIGVVFSLGIYNVISIYVVIYMEAITRSILSSLRLYTVLIVSFALGWEKFVLGRIIGFFCFGIGISIYYEIYTSFQCFSEWYPLTPIYSTNDEENPSHSFGSDKSYDSQKPKEEQKNNIYDLDFQINDHFYSPNASSLPHSHHDNTHQEDLKIGQNSIPEEDLTPKESKPLLNKKKISKSSNNQKSKKEKGKNKKAEKKREERERYKRLIDRNDEEEEESQIYTLRRDRSREREKERERKDKDVWKQERTPPVSLFQVALTEARSLSLRPDSITDSQSDSTSGSSVFTSTIAPPNSPPKNNFTLQTRSSQTDGNEWTEEKDS